MLIEVLKSQGGFAQMMQDILDVLITAEARQASHKLSVEFKFDEVTDPIKATLEQFREAIHRTQRVLEKRPELPNDNLMWPLSKVLRSFVTAFPESPPADFPPVSAITSTGHTGIDAQLACLARPVSDVRWLWRGRGRIQRQVGDVANALRYTY
ncbi:hypothetical protein, partial [Burkholderia thailandensis]|uniref:hypothetical protein n=1 Tax=Burkholderia thailandensis TaxID=57975 RepID=UPI00217CD146